MSQGDGSHEVGGAGTVYLEQLRVTEDTGARAVTHRILRVNNGDRPEPLAQDTTQGPLRNLLDGLYDDITEAGGITWLWHTENQYEFNEVRFIFSSILYCMPNGF